MPWGIARGGERKKRIVGTKNGELHEDKLNYEKKMKRIDLWGDEAAKGGQTGAKGNRTQKERKYGIMRP